MKFEDYNREKLMQQLLVQGDLEKEIEILLDKLGNKEHFIHKLEDQKKGWKVKEGKHSIQEQNKQRGKLEAGEESLQVALEETKYSLGQEEEKVRRYELELIISTLIDTNELLSM